MTLAIVATALLASAPTAQVRIASAGFHGVDVEEQKATFYSDYFAQRFAEATGVKVTTSSEIAAVVGMERQKKLLGCSDEEGSGSCMSELANALGADALINGSVTKVSGRLALIVKVVRSRDGQSLAGASETLDEDDVLPWLAEKAKAIAPEVAAGLGFALPAQRKIAWVPLGVGAGLLVAGGVSYGIASGLHRDVYGANSSLTGPSEAAKSANTGKILTYVSYGAFAGGAAAAIVGAVLSFRSGSAPKVEVAPVAGAGTLGISVGASFE